MPRYFRPFDDQILNDATRAIVTAALSELDNVTRDTLNRSAGPCGDALANQLDKTIRKALTDAADTQSFQISI